MKQKSSISIVALAVLISALNTTSATPPPEHKPHYCGIDFCVEVVGYSQVTRALIANTATGEGITLQLADGTTIAFSSAAVQVASTGGLGGPAWSRPSESLAVTTQCIMCEQPGKFSPQVVATAIHGRADKVATYVEGASICVWAARYRWREAEMPQARIELGRRQCL